MKLILLLAMAALAGCAGSKPTVEQVEDPVALLRNNDTELQAILKKGNYTNEDIERIKYLGTCLVDFDKMAGRSIPKEVLDTLSYELKAEFAKEFQRMVVNSSTHKFMNGLGVSDSTIYDAPAYKRDGAEVWVSVQSWNNGEYMPMVYKMDRFGNSWRIWDLVVYDLSTVRNYREQAGIILETNSFRELIKIVKGKADDFVP